MLYRLKPGQDRARLGAGSNDSVETEQNMSRLTPTQHDVLDRAAERVDGAVRSDMTASVLKALMVKGFVAGSEGLLHITEAGRSTLSASVPSSPAELAPAKTSLPTTGKLATIVELLQRPTGANIAELRAATGWQAHSVRGALSGALKTRLRLTIESRKTEAGRTYHITNQIAATHSGTVGA